MTSRMEHLLPKKIEKLLASLSVKYRKDGDDLALKVLVNSRYQIVEEYAYDNLDGGQDGHAVYFQVSEIIYHEIMDDLDRLTTVINLDMNKLANVPGEFIAAVFIELEESAEIKNWREKSGVLIDRTSNLMKVATEDQDRLWGDGILRAFISHKSEYKVEAKALKEELLKYGVSCFVAHEDIEPTREWQDEIERALQTMHIMVPLLTERYSESDWTDQEVGVAIGRGIPVTAVRIEKDPYGFIGKYQGISGASKTSEELAIDLFRLFIENEKIKPIAIEAFVFAVQQVYSYESANSLAEFLPAIDLLTKEQASRLVQSFNNNSQVCDSYGFNGKNPKYHGGGLVYHLERIMGDKYKLEGRNHLILADSEPPSFDDDDIPF